MKKKLIFISVVMSLFGLFWVYGQAVQTTSFTDGLGLKISTPKSTYVLGEIVTLNFEIANNTSSDIWLKGETLDSGYLTISIASADRKYKKYRAVGKPEKFKPSLLKKGEKANSTARVLWNASLAENSSDPKLFEETDILTSYAFPRSGVFYVKATLIFVGKGLTTVESEPIEIQMEEPSGEDLLVWNKIKGNGGIAYFIQEGDFLVPSYKKEEREKLLLEIEQIANQHPESFYAQSLRQSLNKFNASEAERKAYFEKLRQQKQPQ